MTAESLAEATELAASVAIARGWTLDARLVEQNVRSSDLDLGAERPFLELARPGVWFPALSSVE